MKVPQKRGPEENKKLGVLSRGNSQLTFPPKSCLSAKVTEMRNVRKESEKKREKGEGGRQQMIKG